MPQPDAGLHYLILMPTADRRPRSCRCNVFEELEAFDDL